MRGSTRFSRTASRIWVEISSQSSRHVAKMSSICFSTRIACCSLRVVSGNRGRGGEGEALSARAFVRQRARKPPRAWAAGGAGPTLAPRGRQRRCRESNDNAEDGQSEGADTSGVCCEEDSTAARPPRPPAHLLALKIVSNVWRSRSSHPRPLISTKERTTAILRAPHQAVGPATQEAGKSFWG